MRRGFRIAAVLAVLLLALLWGWRQADVAPKGRSQRPRLPTMTRAADPASGDAPTPTLHRAASDHATVLCHVSGAGDPGVLQAQRVDDGGGDSVGSIVRSTDASGDLVLTLPPGSWRVSWQEPVEAPMGTRDFLLGVFDLVEGDVHTCTLDRAGFPVSGRVVDTQGRPVAGAEVMGCAMDGPSGEDGTFVGTVPLFAVGEGGCDLRARWEDGLLARYGTVVRVTAFDAQRPIELVVDPEPVAGLGVAVEATPEGVMVSYVHEGTPAERAGLLDGDLIARIDGTPTKGMSVWDFIGRGTGREGTTARLDIVGEDGSSEQVVIRRERLQSPGMEGR